MEKFGSKVLSNLEEDKSHMKVYTNEENLLRIHQPTLKYTVILCRSLHSCSIGAITMFRPNDRLQNDPLQRSDTLEFAACRYLLPMDNVYGICSQLADSPDWGYPL